MARSEDKTRPGDPRVDRTTDRPIRPHISVVIPARNAASTLPGLLESVAAATYAGEREIIVVDDASTDETAAIALSYTSHVVRLPRARGPANARNRGVAVAGGDLILFVDSDTRLRGDTLEAAVQAVEDEGVVAATGIYEPEPLNPGFFPAYYAYLKFVAFHESDSNTIHALGAQCAVIWRDVFLAAGGFRPIPWGVDVENEELGHRIERFGRIALARRLRVAHHFPGFRKLFRVFTSRVYWWVLFRAYSGRNETVLMTSELGWATASLPLSVAALGSMGWLPRPWGLSLAMLVAVGGLVSFARGYRRFWEFCARRRGIVYAVGAVAASAVFAVVITMSAVYGVLTTFVATLLRRPTRLERKLSVA